MGLLDRMGMGCFLIQVTVRRVVRLGERSGTPKSPQMNHWLYH